MNCWTLTAVSGPVGLGGPRICVFNKILGDAAVISLLGHALRTIVLSLLPAFAQSIYIGWLEPFRVVVSSQAEKFLPHN